MTKTDDERLPPVASMDALVRAIHAASGRDGEWPLVLERLGDRLGARIVTLGHHEFASGSDSSVVVSSGGADFAQDMTAYAARNPWFLSSGDYVAGRVLTGDELIGNGELRRTDFYRGFLRPRGLLHLLCGVVAQRPHGAHLLSAYRAEDEPPFDADAKAELARLLDHVTLALENAWRWREADDLAHALLALTDQDAHAAILVTADGEPVHRNPAAERLLEQRIGLRLEGSRLVAASPADRRLLADTIARVAQMDPAQAPAAPGVLTLACTPPMPPVVAVVRAAGPVYARQTGVRRGLAMVAVRGGHAAHDPATCAFARQYELTAAQAKVSALVFAGQPLSTIAHSLSLSENTVRSHLRQIFQKTDTHGQMELVHLHARVCPTLP
ncbi:MAG: helix-turn-helix transcriptional regulator [Proteobacteria bacterium]|nr:helix-turn-helix transcriptional regulator [Pseudomonadota bacterium]